MQLTGLALCLKGAAKITHKAQQIVAIVSKWHALATCSPSALNDRSSQGSGVTYGPAHPNLNRGSSSEDLEASGREWNSLEEELAHDLEAYQQVQALGTFSFLYQCPSSVGYCKSLGRTSFWAMSVKTADLYIDLKE